MQFPDLFSYVRCSANGIITATSRDRAAGIEQGITINMAGGLSSDEIEKMRKEAELNAKADAERQELFKFKDSVRATVGKIEEVPENIFEDLKAQ